MSFEGIVVLSSARSGTTLVQRLLDAHPSLSGPPETNVFNGCARFLRDEPVASGFGVGTISGLAFAGIPEAKLLERVREFAFGLLGTLREKSGKPLWVEKSPYDMFHVPLIARLCGDRVRYLWLVRHPLDVIVSSKELFDKMGMYPFEFHDYVRRFPAPLEAIAWAWVDTNRAVQQLAAERPDLVARLRYEDLVRDPAAELGRLLPFFGLEGDPAAMVDAGVASGAGRVGLGDWKTYERKTVSADSVGRWRALAPAQIAGLSAIVRPLAEELGYDDLPTAPPTDPAAARRAYQLGRMVAQLQAKVPDDPTGR